MTYRYPADEVGPAVTSTLLFERVDPSDQQPLEQHYLLHAHTDTIDPVFLELMDSGALTLKAVGYEQNKALTLYRHQVTALCEIALAWQQRVVEHEEMRRAAREAQRAQQAIENAKRETHRLALCLEADVSERDGSIVVTRKRPLEDRVNQWVCATWPEMQQALSDAWYGVGADVPEDIPF